MGRFHTAIIALFLLIHSPGHAQRGAIPPPPPVQQIGMDPFVGPICDGPLGPGPCQAVQQFLWIQLVASTVDVPMLGMHPTFGPMCDGPLGPGPCDNVRSYIAAQLIGAQRFPLNVIGNAPGIGPICLGPLGPAPCQVIQAYLAQQQAGKLSGAAFDPRAARVIPGGTSETGPMCSGPFGPSPCTLVGQFSLDRMSGPVPAASSFGLPTNLSSPQRLAAECAQRVGLDVAAFAGCARQQIILPRNQQAVLDCAVSNRDAAGFANCAAPSLGIRLSDEQRVVAGCAMTTRGDASRFTSCVGGQYLSRSLNENDRAILNCAANSNGEAGRFASCASGMFLAQEQQAVLNCAVSASDPQTFATCAASNSAIRMSDDQRILARCALRSNGDRNTFGVCAGAAFLNRNLSPDEQAVLNCAVSANGDTGRFAGCSASRLLGRELSREQRVALECAAQSQGDPTGMATCAGANMFNLQLNPEQQIAVQCVVSTGGQPHAAAGCIGSRLTMRELTKCMTDGVGGNGCFGDSNDLIGRNGWTARTLGQITGGPNSIVNNPDQIWGGDNSFVRNPGQVFGGSNSFVRNPSQIWGGNNSVFNNPRQLSPRPLQVGSIGKTRICLPWC